MLGWLLVACVAGGCGRAPDLPVLAADAVILAFGDSLTHGTGAAQGESYPAMLAQFTGRTVVNGGVPGEVSADGLRRLPGLLVQHRPALVILCHGGNDILRKLDLRRTMDNLEEMIRLSQDRGAAVMLLGVPQPGLFLGAAEIYDAIAESTGVVYLDDLIPGVLSNAGMKSDPVHPNAAGYRQMAQSIHAVLQDSGAL